MTSDEAETVLTEAEWASFWEMNAEGLADEVGDEATCRRLAEAGKLLVGGGAAERYRIVLGRAV